MQRARRACGACRQRKVKCNGDSPCQQCTHLGLKCEYPDPSPSSRSRKGSSRGHIVAEYQSRSAPKPTLLPLALREWDEQSTSTPRNHSPDNPVFDPTFFEALVPDYKRCVFPVFPVVYDFEIHEAIKCALDDREEMAFIHAFAAITIHISQTGPLQRGDTRDNSISLCLKALEIRGPMLPQHRVSIRSIMTADFVAICLFAYQQHVDMAFIYLREAITKLQLLRIDSPEVSRPSDPAENHRRQRLHWIIFIYERYIAITYYHTIVLSPLNFLPELNDTIDAQIQEWLICAIKLFSIVDSTFVDNWLNKGDNTSITTSWIEDKHHKLGQELHLNNIAYKQLSEEQQVDLVVTEYWLRTTVWQMGLSKCLLSSRSSVEITSLLFPMQLTRRLRYLLDNKSRAAITTHGSSILQKIFNITNTIADILIHVSSAATDQDITNSIDDFSFLHKYLLQMSRFRQIERQILADKFEQLSKIFPGRHSSFSTIDESDGLLITDSADAGVFRRSSGPGLPE